MKVLKFGGSSVGSPEAVKQVIDIVNRAVNEDTKIGDTKIGDTKLVVVVSAFSRTTDQLLTMAKLAANGDSAYMPHLQQLADRHLQTLEHFLNARALESAKGKVNSLLGDLADVLHGTL